MAPASIDAVPLLIAALDDEDSHVRLVALGALECFGPKAAAAIPELLDMHKNDKGALHRGCVLKTLAVIDQEGKVALPVLMKALEDAEPQMRRFAAESLGMLGRHAEPAVEKLIDRLQDPDTGVRVYAAGALWKIDRRAKLAVPVLIEVLQTGSSFERMWATWHIPEIGPDARAASHALAENLTQSFPQAGAAQALCRMGPLPADVVDALRRAKENEREDVGVWAAFALWKFDHDPKQLEYLVDVAAHRSFNEQAHAFRILGEIGPEAKLVVPTLVKLVRHPKIDVRRQAAETLMKIAPSALGSADKP
jgi:HEAT repeat protein